jgi:hypothetical protein
VIGDIGDRPQRPRPPIVEQPQRPERPERPERPDRAERPRDRTGGRNGGLRDSREERRRNAAPTTPHDELTEEQKAKLREQIIGTIGSVVSL